MEPPFDKLDGVLSTTSGYTGGSKVDPTYEEVSAGGTGHVEAVAGGLRSGQGELRPAARGVLAKRRSARCAAASSAIAASQYRTAIFVHDEEQRRLAEQSKQALVDSKSFDGPIVTEIVTAGPFYPAEEYHQDYYEKNPLRYKFYRWNCGRDQRLAQVWGEQATH